MALTLELWFWFTALCWVAVAVTAGRGIVRLPSLPPVEPRDAPTPAVSAVIAARDEARDVETTLRRLLAQRHVALEVIVVDDRSSDGTGAVLDALAAADRRLQAVHVETVPGGWLGKPHALHRGVARASHGWLVVADADITMAPDLVARAVRAAEREKADHVSLVPRQRDATLLGKACVIALFFGLPDAFCKANRDRLGSAIGAFNLIRADALRDAGGFEALRMEVVDDHLLGRLLHRAGKRSRGYFAAGDLEMDLARTPAGLVRAVEKNAFAIMRYRVSTFAVLAVAIALLLAGAAAGPWAGSPAGWAAGLSFLGLAAPGVLMARRLEWPVAAGLLAPVGFLFVMLAGANSVVKTLARGGVRWRGDFHPLPDLRAGRVP